MGEKRGVNSAIGVILLAALAIVLAGSIAVFVLSLEGDVQEPAPVIGQSSGEFIPQDGNDGGIVRIEHVSGESVDVSDIEIAVDAECEEGDKQGRLIDLPATDGNNFDDEQIEGDNIFDQRSLNRYGGGALLEEEYSPSDTITLRITDNKCTLSHGATTSARVVYTPSGVIIIDKEFTA